MGRHFMNRVVRRGSTGGAPRGNGPGRYYTEIARVSPWETLAAGEGWLRLCRGGQKRTVSMAEAGSKPKDIWDANNGFPQKNGLRPEGRLYAHGEARTGREAGYPVRRSMKVQAWIELRRHPVCKNGRVGSRFCDNYLVTEDGPTHVSTRRRRKS